MTIVNPTAPETISIPLGNGKSLVVESGRPFFNELYIGIKSEEGEWQNIATIDTEGEKTAPERIRISMMNGDSGTDFAVKIQ